MICSKGINLLRKMTGSDNKLPRSQWGYRNYYTPKGDETEVMERLEESGFVKRDSSIFYATKNGCRVIGLNDKQTKRALANVY